MNELTTLDDGELDFREMARTHAGRARALLDADPPAETIYVAVEIRMALEALVYDLAKNFTDDLPADRAQWQPPRLLRRLLEIDPMADQSLSMAVQDAAGTFGEPGAWHSLGQERRLTLKEIKANYDSIGAYLHIPTLDQIQRHRAPPASKLEPKCRSILSRIDETLSSPIWNLNFRWRSKLECRQCGNLIRRQVSALQSTPGGGAEYLKIECFDCSASYQLTREGEEILWSPEVMSVPCRHKGCEQILYLWRRDMAFGNKALCPQCGQANRMDMLLTADGSNEGNPAAIKALTDQFWVATPAAAKPRRRTSL